MPVLLLPVVLNNRLELPLAVFPEPVVLLKSASAPIAVLPLENVAVSTSGDYERFFDEDGVRYHHIIDPSTGDSARAVRSVTIIGDDATWTDALSTTVFVLGPEKGLALVDALGNVDAVLIDRGGVLRYSKSLLRLGPPAPGQPRAAEHNAVDAASSERMH